MFVLLHGLSNYNYKQNPISFVLYPCSQQLPQPQKALPDLLMPLSLKGKTTTALFVLVHVFIYRYNKHPHTHMY